MRAFKFKLVCISKTQTVELWKMGWLNVFHLIVLNSDVFCGIATGKVDGMLAALSLAPQYQWCSTVISCLCAVLCH